jgi:hypothetical protein
VRTYGETSADNQRWLATDPNPMCTMVFPVEYYVFAPHATD